MTDGLTGLGKIELADFGFKNEPDELEIGSLDPLEKFFIENSEKITSDYKEFQKFSEQYDGASGSDDEKISNLERKIDEYKSLLKKYECELVKEFNNSLGFEVIRELPLEFSRWGCSVQKFPQCFQVLKNKMINMKEYAKEVDCFIKTKQIDLINRFFDLKVVDHTVTYSVAFLAAETHKGGKMPALISFLIDGIEKKVVFKPRSAEIDIAVIALFKRLNEIDDALNLPEYKIEQYDQYSVWEYIPGRSPTSTADGGDVSLKNGETVRKLKNLELICSRIGLTDLHHENIIVSENTLQWVPIDLEVIKIGHRTGLYERETISGVLNDRVLREISSFNSASFSSCRFVPVATAVLLPVCSAIFMKEDEEGDSTVLQSVDLIERTSNVLLKILLSALDGRYEIVDAYNLNQLIQGDIRNNDVPYLVNEKDSIFYCGRSQERILIFRSNQK